MHVFFRVSPKHKARVNANMRLVSFVIQNGCSQSSRFPTAGQGERRLWERDWVSGIYHNGFSLYACSKP